MSHAKEARPRRKPSPLARRRFLAYFSGLGLGATLLPGVLWAKIQDRRKLRVTREMIAEAEGVCGLEFSDDERNLMASGLDEYLKSYETLREVPVSNAVSPAIHFDPYPPGSSPPKALPASPVEISQVETVVRPKNLDEVAFWPVTRLAELIRTKQVTSLELTNLYLSRLKKYNSKLHCVINLTEDLAQKQAKKADAEIASGRYRGPLHGIPWGAKDLLAVKGYPTTWGATPYKDRVIDKNAAVVRRLEEAGAVLVAKLTLGALAWGDVWFDEMTRNPWNLEQGSSGSSAGPASATAAGLVGFSIGSETWGSIVSPSTRCGVTGHRPTYGLVSREGAMALSWTMDKLGPMCRTVEDCALVLHAIAGKNKNDQDPSTRDLPFHWNNESSSRPRTLRVGYVASAFKDSNLPPTWKKNDEAVLDTLRSVGVKLKPIELPDLPVSSLAFILNAEAATAFDELTRSNRDDELVRQVRNAWPNAFRQARFIPAVEYIQANRVRTLLLQKMEELFGTIDIYVCPSFGGDNLLLTNLTGHPSVCVPNGFSDQGTPTSITFMGGLFMDEPLLRVAKAYQDATSHHKKHPVLES